MATAVIPSRALSGLQSPEVAVEVHLANGLPGFTLVGLPEAAVRESRDRVRAAIQNSGLEFPARRITINLAPGDLPKEGTRFDLPMALGIIVASGQLPAKAVANHELIGELALTGALRPVRGILPSAVSARHSNRRLVIPEGNAREAALAGHASLACVSHLSDLIKYFKGEHALTDVLCDASDLGETGSPDMADVVGQPGARRALEIAAAGTHSILMLGPPGSGKTMLASRLPGLLPAMTEDEALESAMVQSLRGEFDASRWRCRPWRAPHHTASATSLVGGGGVPRPGEISAAHHGILFLDELPEFHRHVLEVLREPLETGSIIITRARGSARFPAQFQLVAAMNPCPCGYEGDAAGRCRCTPDRIQTYRGRISGPLLDRFDMHLEVPAVPVADLALPHAPAENSAAIRARAIKARERQQRRQGCPNSRLESRRIEAACALSAPARALLVRAMERLGLSARAFHRVMKLARTIADLANADAAGPDHVAEAIQYRCLDRRG